MTRKKKKDNHKDEGTLFIRYDKNTLCGKVVEQLKDTYKQPKHGRSINSVVLNLIFLSEIVEPFNLYEFNLEQLSHVYYESLRLFSDKTNQAKLKIDSINSHMARQKYKQATALAVEDSKSNPLVKG